MGREGGDAGGRRAFRYLRNHTQFFPHTHTKFQIRVVSGYI